MVVGAEFGLQLCTWDGAPTRHIPLDRLTDDEHGSWYRWAAGTPESRPDGATTRHGCDLVVLVPHHGLWVARFGDDGVLDRHATVVTATATTELGISAVELDLDVVRFTGGRVTVVDQGHVDRRRADLDHPVDLMAHGLRTTRMLYDALARGAGPFGAPADERLRSARRTVAVAR